MTDEVLPPHVLHVGCYDDTMPREMSHCRETRLDIDPECNPDIVADMSDLPDGIGPFDCVYGSHCLEHLPFHKVQPCLKGWLKVLKPGGAVVQFVPDCEGVEPTDDVMYISRGGLAVKARDLFYGHSDLIEKWPHMQHLSGFTAATLKKQLEDAGFENVRVGRGQAEGCHNLFAAGTKPK
jgi:SAM-dependent methyltransferase